VFPRAISLFLLISAFSQSPSCALTVSINGKVERSITVGDILRTGHRVPVGGVDARGLTLLEAVPLLISCDRITVQGATGERAWNRADLAERLGGGYFVADSGGVDLWFAGDTVPDVDRIDLRAEPLLDTELTVWLSWEGVDQLKAEIAGFADRHGMTINAIETPSIKSKLIAVVRGGGKIPDVVMVQSSDLPELTAARVVQPFDPDSVPDVIRKGLDAMRLDGRHWAAPFYFDTQLAFIRTDISQVPPVDWSFTDMEKIAAEIHRDGNIPLSWNAFSAYWLAPFQTAFGKDSLVDEDGAVTIDDEPTRRAIRYLTELQARGLLQMLERDAMVTLFVEGKIGIILTGSYSIPRFQELGIPFAVVPLPVNDELDRPAAPFLDFKGFAITRRTQNPVLARRLIQHLCSTGVQERFTSALAKLPAERNALKMVERYHPFAEAMFESLARGVTVPPDRSYVVYKDTMWKLLRLAFGAPAEIEELLQKGQGILDQDAVRQ
jgi:ABC-type glycerol-3-phosphate transport system substrate-binding protein